MSSHVVSIYYCHFSNTSYHKFQYLSASSFPLGPFIPSPRPDSTNPAVVLRILRTHQIGADSPKQKPRLQDLRWRIGAGCPQVHPNFSVRTKEASNVSLDVTARDTPAILRQKSVGL